MNRRFNILRKFILVFLVMAATVYCQKENAGTTGASFLKLGVGARAAGLGYSALTLSEDASALYWNPAALVNMRTTDVTINFNNLYAGMKHGFVGMADRDEFDEFLRQRAAKEGAVRCQAVFDKLAHDESGQLWVHYTPVTNKDYASSEHAKPVKVSTRLSF